MKNGVIVALLTALIGVAYGCSEFVLSQIKNEIPSSQSTIDGRIVFPDIGCALQGLID